MEIPLEMLRKVLTSDMKKEILRRICKTEYTPTELAEEFGMTRGGLNRHLRELEDANLIKMKIIEGRPGPPKQIMPWEGIFSSEFGPLLQNIRGYEEAKKIISKHREAKEAPEPTRHIIERLKGRIDGLEEKRTDVSDDLYGFIVWLNQAGSLLKWFLYYQKLFVEKIPITKEWKKYSERSSKIRETDVFHLDLPRNLEFKEEVRGEEIPLNSRGYINEFTIGQEEELKYKNSLLAKSILEIIERYKQEIPDISESMVEELKKGTERITSILKKVKADLESISGDKEKREQGTPFSVEDHRILENKINQYLELIDLLH